MKKPLLLSICFLLGLGTFCVAQNPIISNCVNPANFTMGSDIGIASPQTWSFMKYGGSTPNLYTGTVSASIPIYTYQDMDFTLPITLEYASNGYVPNVQSNEVGLGWYLNAGGCITREIRGVPDEYRNVNLNGYLRFQAEDYSNTDYNLGTGTRNTDGVYVHDYNGRKVETEPDIYTFNFMGHSGTFTLAGKQVYVFAANHPYGEYVIALDELGRSITIKTGDGYKYSFEPLLRNGRQSVEIYERDKPNSTLHLMAYISNTWMLREIVAPNGRTVTFEYSMDLIEQARPGGLDQRAGQDVTGEYRALSEIYFSKYSQPVTKLDKIIIDYKVEVQFVYSDRKYKEIAFIKNEKIVQLNTPKKMDSITVVEKGADNTTTTIKRCTLEYAYSSPSGAEVLYNRVMFLRSANISGEGTYRMEYHNENEEFPFHGTVSYDHWGYFNRKPSYIVDELYPEIIRNASNFAESVNISTVREPNLQYAMQGILTKMSYPTGGYTTFEYEPHMYRVHLVRNQSSVNMPYIMGSPFSFHAGGVRIHKIADYASDSSKHSKTYAYSLSGTLLYPPAYYYEEFRYNRLTNAFKEAVWSVDCRDVSAYHTDKSHIEYPRVQEVFDDGAKIEYDFANYSNYPDLFKSRDETVAAPDYYVDQADLHNNFVRESDYSPRFRGTLLQKTYYNKSAKKEKTITWNYPTFPVNCRYVESVKQAADEYYIHRTFLESPLLTSTSVVEYPDQGDPFTTEISYEYNGIGQLRRQTKICSDGSRERCYTTRVYDVVATEGSVYWDMHVHNVLDLPLTSSKKIAYKTGEAYGAETTVSSVNITYQQLGSGLFCPSRYSGYILGSGVLDESYIYEADGRLTEVTDRSGLTTTYVWGYEYQYPLAKIVGAANYTVKAAIGSLFWPTSASLPAATESALRSIAGALVTTYEHIPHVGITKITDPTGRKREYTYTASGKLSGEYDDQGNRMLSCTYSNDNN